MLTHRPIKNKPEATRSSGLFFVLKGNVLLNAEKFDVEYQRAERWDAVVAPFAVSELGGDEDGGFLANVHLGQGDFPTRDDTVLSKGEGERINNPAIPAINATVEGITFDVNKFISLCSNNFQLILLFFNH